MPRKSTKTSAKGRRKAEKPKSPPQKPAPPAETGADTFMRSLWEHVSRDAEMPDQYEVTMPLARGTGPPPPRPQNDRREHKWLCIKADGTASSVYVPRDPDEQAAFFGREIEMSSMQRFSTERHDETFAAYMIIAYDASPAPGAPFNRQYPVIRGDIYVFATIDQVFETDDDIAHTTHFFDYDTLFPITFALRVFGRYVNRRLCAMRESDEFFKRRAAQKAYDDIDITELD